MFKNPSIELMCQVPKGLLTANENPNQPNRFRLLKSFTLLVSLNFHSFNQKKISTPSH